MNALARICAKLPPSQWIQLKIGRLLEVGAGRNKAPIGCKKHTIVVIVPRIACGLSSDDQAPSSTTISTDAAIVRAHVKTINIRCHCNLSLNGLINVNKEKKKQFISNERISVQYLQQTTDLCRTIGCQPMSAWNIAPIKCQAMRCQPKPWSWMQHAIVKIVLKLRRSMRFRPNALDYRMPLARYHDNRRYFLEFEYFQTWPNCNQKWQFFLVEKPTAETYVLVFHPMRRADDICYVANRN